MKNQPENKWNGATIKTARKARKLTQKELARFLGCRQQTITEWEAQNIIPSNAYQKLLEWCFANYDTMKASMKNETVGEQ